MVCGVEMFREVVCKVLLPGVPCDVEIANVDLVCYPKECHFHCTRPLTFDSVVGDGDGGFIVTMYGCGWLGMS